MAEYFNLFEFTRSGKAKELGIDNTPSEQEVDNIIEVMRVMDKIRGRWTAYCNGNCIFKPQIIVTSGYRCEALNEAVGGSKTSAHKIGSAVDFKAANGHNKELFEVCRDVLIEEGIPFEELINERDYSWIHLALRDLEGNQRREIYV